MWYRLKNSLLMFLLLLMSPMGVSSQSAETVFNESAAEYVTGSPDRAKLMIMEGLRQFPNDPKLLELLSKIQEEQQQEEQQQDQDEQDQEQQEQGEQDQQQQDDGEQEMDQPQDQEGQQPPPREGEISREDAERLLEMLSREEEKVQKKVNEEKVKTKPRKTEKDW